MSSGKHTVFGHISIVSGVSWSNLKKIFKHSFNITFLCHLWIQVELLTRVSMMSLIQKNNSPVITSQHAFWLILTGNLCTSFSAKCGYEGFLYHKNGPGQGISWPVFVSIHSAWHFHPIEGVSGQGSSIKGNKVRAVNDVNSSQERRVSRL